MIIDKNVLSQLFAQRLAQSMIRAGFVSSRSTAGVDVGKLAAITGYSTVICRKYLKGEVIPEPTKLIDIAHAMNVSPGWLLFGEVPDKHLMQPDGIALDKSTLHYLLEKAAPLFQLDLPEQDVAHFLADLIEDVSQIKADPEQAKKIIDLAIASIRKFPR